MRQWNGSRKRSCTTRLQFADIDLRSFFDNVRHRILFEKIARRVNDLEVMHLLKLLVKATRLRKGLSQGGVLSPVLSNVYLNEVDRMLERAQETTRRGPYTYLEYARFADDLVVLVDGYAPHGWLLKAVNQRLREELAKLQVTEVSTRRRVDTLTWQRRKLPVSWALSSVGCEACKANGGRTIRPSSSSAPHCCAKLKDIFRRFSSQPVGRVVQLINPIVRGWVNYFAIRRLRSLLWRGQRLGGEKGAAASDAGPKPTGFRLEEGGVGVGSTGNSGLFNNYRVRRPSLTPRKRSQRDGSHNPRGEAGRKAGCGKSACPV